jgi:hypothetical protein
MKIYYKLLEKIRNNKPIEKAVSIFTIIVTLRYGRINLIPINLSSNSTQQVEQVHNYVEEDMQLINTDGKVKDGLSNKSSSHLIKIGSGILIEISESSKSRLSLSGGDLGKSGPGPRAKANALANTGQTSSSGSSVFVRGFTTHNIYCNYYHKNDNIPSCR